MSVSRKRETRETSIEVFLEIEGKGEAQVDTGIELLDQILLTICDGGGFDLKVKVKGDLETGDHHSVEDTAITLGSALAQEIKSGIGSSTVPSGSCMAMAAARFGEVGYAGDFLLEHQSLGEMNLENFSHFLRALAYNGGFNLAISAKGGDDRSMIDAMSMALGRALKKAARDDLSWKSEGKERKKKT